jgi:DNA-binding NarL/FixJ family response regulator
MSHDVRADSGQRASRSGDLDTRRNAVQYNLLIVDDEPKIYHALRRALHAEGDWQTIYANGADEALQKLEEEQIDVVIADENMPGMSGSQLLSVVRRRWPDVIRMMLTGDPRIDVVMNAVNNGEIYRFFTKPCNEVELVVAIREALQMKELKKGSRQLLETVKRQSAQIRDLAPPDSPADVLAQGPDSGYVPSDLQRPTLSLGSSKPEAPPVDGFDLDENDDVDSLLEDIRKELDSL